MLAPLTDWKATIRMPVRAGVQFVDFAFNLDNLPRLSKTFIERRDPNAVQQDGTEPVELIVVPPSDDDTLSDSLYEARAEDVSYSINGVRALEIFREKWVPIPYLRRSGTRNAAGNDIMDRGPSNWARARVVELTDRERADKQSHYVVFAFDTEIAPKLPNRPYAGLTLEDAADEEEFLFAYRIEDIGWFLSNPQPMDKSEAIRNFQEWVDTWLLDLFYEFKRAQRPGRPLRPETFEHRLEHWARYITFLEILHVALSPPQIKLINTLSEPECKSLNRDRPVKPVSVDVVLDVGNSRTCGVLIESYPNEDSIDLNNSLVLQLRNLGAPEHVYARPFASVVELSQAKFGRYDLSRRSTRDRTFFWPSLVRVGEEAEQIRGDADGTEASTGLSSPKRYLWDKEPVVQEWRFQPGDYPHSGAPPPIELAARRELTAAGEVIAQLRRDRRGRRADQDLVEAGRLLFSRSSFYTLMVAEILVQAFSMMNDAGVRGRRRHSDTPRQMRRLIITLPPATPIQEQAIMKRRAEAARELVWRLAGWTRKNDSGHEFDIVRKPEILVHWDEATCCQLVYLYSEITQKFGGAVDDYANLIGRPRPDTEPNQLPTPDPQVWPSIRVASVDIGGGTTDLMITTYNCHSNRALSPTQNFREGFRIAGDDLLKAIIEQVVIPGFEAHLSECGLPRAHELLTELFGGDRADTPEQEKHLRKLFVLRVLQPLALEVLSQVEVYSAQSEDHLNSISLANVSDAAAVLRYTQEDERLLPERINAYLERPARERGGQDFRIEDVRIHCNDLAVREVVNSVLGHVADNLCEAINAYGCDVLLIAGRPSRLSAVIDLFVERLPLPPEKIVPLSRYRAGVWYPFRRADNVYIEDPKTATAVGGMLCALAEKQIQNFTLFTQRLAMRSTAKFIGELERNGQLLNKNVVFADVNLDNPGGFEEAVISYFAPMQLGFRQLPFERWTATPLYRLTMRSEAKITTAHLPLKIRIERVRLDRDDENGVDVGKRMALEAEREAFRVTEVEDNQQTPRRPGDAQLSLDTLSVKDGYWLDTGILNIG